MLFPKSALASSAHRPTWGLNSNQSSFFKYALNAVLGRPGRSPRKLHNAPLSSSLESTRKCATSFPLCLAYSQRRCAVIVVIGSLVAVASRLPRSPWDAASSDTQPSKNLGKELWCLLTLYIKTGRSAWRAEEVDIYIPHASKPTAQFDGRKRGTTAVDSSYLLATHSEIDAEMLGSILHCSK